MKAAIFCPGPSLGCTDGRGQCDLRIGVNRAAEWVELDWWVGLDAAAFLKFRPIGRPRILCFERAKRQLMSSTSADRFAEFECLTGKELRLRSGAMHSLFSYSSTAAIALAVEQGAKHVDVYGHDMSGSTDASGEAAPGRSDKRWGRESKLWDEAVEWADIRGTKVVRHTVERT